MSPSLREVEREALALPVEDRARLVDKLWESLGEDSSLAFGAEWKTEIERRAQEIATGKVRSIPGEEVSRKARKIAGLSS